MSGATCILSAVEQGDHRAAGDLLPLVYDELRRLAAQKPGHKKRGQALRATARVQEVYIRLVDLEKAWHGDSRGTSSPPPRPCDGYCWRLLAAKPG